MEENNLAIGTVCSLKNGQTVMIIGYYARKFENGIKTYDYEAIKYPEGTLSQDRYYFDKIEISEVVFEGYKNPSYKGMIEKFSNLIEVKDTEVRYKFDENGRVVIDYTIETKEVEQAPVAAFGFDENGRVVSDSTVEPIELEDTNFYKFDENSLEEETLEVEDEEPTFIFDENGRVVLDKSVLAKEEKEIENPFVVSQDEVKETDSDSKKWPIFKKLKFDSNGVVLDAEENTVEAA